MSKIKVLAGDIENATWTFGFGVMNCPSTTEHLFAGENIVLKEQIEELEVVDEESQKKLAGTAGWGLAGAALLGPLGAIGGMLLGGNKKQVAFMCALKDGRKFLAQTDSKTWVKLKALAF